MDTTADNNNEQARHDLFVRVKTKKSPKHLNLRGVKDIVKMLSVEVDETETEDSETTEVNIHFQSRAGSKLTKADAGK